MGCSQPPLAGAIAPVSRVLFFSLFLVFSLLECEYKLYGGAWSLFTPGANNPQLKTAVHGKTGAQAAPQRLREPGGAAKQPGRGPGERIFNIEFAFFFNVETFRHKPAPVFKSLKHL